MTIRSHTLMHLVWRTFLLQSHVQRVSFFKALVVIPTYRCSHTYTSLYVVPFGSHELTAAMPGEATTVTFTTVNLIFAF
ncbi:hypothetical protein FKM82_023143 [Ascaphus truei]